MKILQEYTTDELENELLRRANEKKKEKLPQRVREAYPADKYGIWQIYGEDPNADFGGYHHEPLLGTVEGTYQQACDFAATLNSFYTWGTGGRLVLIEATKL